MNEPILKINKFTIEGILAFILFFFILFFELLGAVFFIRLLIEAVS